MMAIQVDLDDLKRNIAPSHIDNFIELIHTEALVVNSPNKTWPQVRRAYDRINSVNDELVLLARIFEVATFINVTSSKSDDKA